MAKRQAGNLHLNQPSTSKKQKTFDPYKLLESLKRLSISQDDAVSISCSSNALSRFSDVRNDRDKNLIQWHKIPKLKNKLLLDLKMAIETLKLSILKLHCCKPEDVDMSELFSIAYVVLLRVEFRIQCGRNFDIHHFVIQEFVYRQTQMFSEQFHLNRDMIEADNYITSRGTILMDDDPILRHEKFIEVRQIIECLAQIAKASKQFSEMLLTEKLDIGMDSQDGTQKSPENVSLPSTSDKPTMIDIICSIAKIIIKDNRYIEKNFGLVITLTHLFESLTSHYDKYKYVDEIDEGLEVLLILVLRVASFDVEIMLSLTNSLVNITKDPNRMTFFKSMCNSSPRVDYSYRFRLSSFMLSGCKFQIIFLLLNHAFRFYDAERITGERLKILIKLVQNLNHLSFIFLTNDEDFLFMVPRRNQLENEEGACSCYRHLLLSTLILSNVLFRSQNSDPEYYFPILALKKDCIIVLNNLLNYCYNNSTFWKISAPQLMMNEIYAILNFSGHNFYLEFRTKIFADTRNISELVVVRNPYKPQSSVIPFKVFSKKFDPNNAKRLDDSDEEDDYKNKQKSSKALKYPEIKMSKKDLLKEIIDDFNVNEYEIFSVGYTKDSKK